MPLSSGQERAATIMVAAGAGRLLLGGGGALIAHGLVDRPTDDLDGFVDSGDDFNAVVDTVRKAFERADYRVSADPDSGNSDQIVSWLVREKSDRTGGRPRAVVKIQLLREPIVKGAVSTPLGPTLDPVELGANKILVIHDRYRHRDFDDLARIAAVIPFSRLLTVADTKQVEPLHREALASDMRNVRLLDRAGFPQPERAPDLIRYFTDLALGLSSGSDLDIATPYSPGWKQLSVRQGDGGGNGGGDAGTDAERRLRDRLGQMLSARSVAEASPAPTARGRCGAPTGTGRPCKNPRGACPHHG